MLSSNELTAVSKEARKQLPKNCVCWRRVYSADVWTVTIEEECREMFGIVNGNRRNSRPLRD